MIKYLSLCLYLLALTHRSVANEDGSERYLRRKSGRSSRQSIAAIASGEPSFSTLVSLLGKTGLDKALDCRWSWWCSSYTVFAPRNSAFDALANGESTKDLYTALTTDDDYTEHLKQLLLYHVVGKSIESSRITDGAIESLQGEDLELTTNGGIKVNEANVIDPFDIKANNGIIHTIDSVLLPSFATSDIVDIATTNENFSVLAAAVVKAGLVDALRGAKLTVLAPTNQAFIDAGIDLDSFEDEDPDLINILQYHVIPGIVVKEDVPNGSVDTLSGDSIDVSVKKSKRNCGIVINESAEVILADVLASNGVIHVIDEVLMPPTMEARAPPAVSIVDVVQSNPDVSILRSLLEKPELQPILDVLLSEGPFTVFAPTDEAFQALGSSALDDLSANPDKLAEIFTYHVISGKFFSMDLPDSILVETVNGKGLAVDARGDGVILNGNTEVIIPDIDTTNGVIHVIDKVLIPPKNIVEILTEDGRFKRLLTAVSLVPGLGETLAEGSPFTIFAPTDEAFSKVPSEDLDALLKDEAALAKVLRYHASGEFLPAQALGSSVPTLVDGESIEVKARTSWYWWGRWRKYLTVTLDRKVHVVEVNHLASNGVIHTIDGVLFP